MGTPAPDAVKRLVDRFDQDRRVFLSGGYREKQSPKAKTPHEQESLKRTIAATDNQIDALVHELCGLTEEEVGIVEESKEMNSQDSRGSPRIAKEDSIMRDARQRVALIVAVLVLASPGLAQTTWWRTYGGTALDEGLSVQQTLDGGYIVAGHTVSFGAGNYDVYLIKTNPSGDTLWTRTYGGARGDGGGRVQQTSDNGYIITGYTASFGAGGSDVYLIKTNASGDTLWTRAYGAANNDGGYSVQQTSDSGYFITATMAFGAESGDVYLIKTNASGDTQWTRTYGGANGDWGYSGRQTSDGGYIVTGSTASFGAGSDDVYLIKTNASGDTPWTRTYGGAYGDAGWSVQQTSDGGYIVAGHTWSFGAGECDVYLIKTNASGDTLWTRTYGGANDDASWSVQQTSDGGYIITGCHAVSFGGPWDVYLIKTSASGDTLWTRTYGGTNYDAGLSVQQTSDGGYIIAGYTYPYITGEDDVYLIKTDANGNMAGGGLSTRRFANSRTALRVQPNPFSSVAVVPGHEAERFILSDISGRKVSICNGNRIGEGLAPGVYFLSPVNPATPRTRLLRIVKGG